MKHSALLQEHDGIDRLYEPGPGIGNMRGGASRRVYALQRPVDLVENGANQSKTAVQRLCHEAAAGFGRVHDVAPAVRCCQPDSDVVTVLVARFAASLPRPSDSLGQRWRNLPPRVRATSQPHLSGPSIRCSCASSANKPIWNFWKPGAEKKGDRRDHDS